mgnify:CR=1 FL=1
MICITFFLLLEGMIAVGGIVPGQSKISERMKVSVINLFPILA